MTEYKVHPQSCPTGLGKMTPGLPRHRVAVMVNGTSPHQPPQRPCRPALELTEVVKQKPELWPFGIGREVDCTRPVTQLWLQPRNPLSGCCWLKKISSSPSMATKAIPRDGSYAWTARDHQGVVCNQSFLLLGHPPVTGRASHLSAAMPGSLVRGCLLIISS